MFVFADITHSVTESDHGLIHKSIAGVYAAAAVSCQMAGVVWTDCPACYVSSACLGSLPAYNQAVSDHSLAYG